MSLLEDQSRKVQAANAISDLDLHNRSIEETINFLSDLDNERNKLYCSVDPSIMMLRDWLIELSSLRKAAYEIRVSLANAERELETKGRKWRR